MSVLVLLHLYCRSGPNGILGKVVRIEDKIVTLDVGKTQIQLTKNAISKELTDAIYPPEK